MPASYSGRQRVGSMSSMRTRNRPPARRQSVEVEQRRKGVAEMQFAIRARREAENGLHRSGAGGLIGIRPCFSSGRLSGEP